MAAQALPAPPTPGIDAAAAPDPTTLLVANAVELAILIAGLFLLWHLVLRPRLRRETPPAALPAWQPPASEFMLYLLVIAGGAVVGSTAFGLLGSRLHVSPDARLILGTAGLHVGLVTTALLLPLRAGPGPWSLASLRSGVATFLIAMPPVLLATWLWTHALQVFGFPTDQQDVVGLFLKAKASPGLLGLMIALPVIVAPVGEEMLFRGSFFRFLRSTAAPRVVAIGLPAAIFATFHFSLVAFVPLVVLAIVFSLAYERTGRIGTTIVAHALFNLHTVILLLAGLNS
jgi:membrane protease YdiL (CAAX protease family)